jgi:hypothetical protein
LAQVPKTEAAFFQLQLPYFVHRAAIFWPVFSRQAPLQCAELLCYCGSCSRTT